MHFQIKTFTTLLLVFVFGQLMAQIHLAPHSGTNGIPGTATNSFIIRWASEPGAVDYEYVMSNNRQCFETCPGDTRQHKTSGDTTATEFNLIADRWYYWITRVIYENGEVSDWTAISNFYTETPKNEGKIAFIAPNPVKDKVLKITIDWATNINAQSLTLHIFNLDGNVVVPPLQIEKQVGRFQEVSFPLLFLASGNYFVRFVVDEKQNTGTSMSISKIVLL